MNANRTHVIATFATGMRAASLVEHLAGKGIAAHAVHPKWTNKRLPPPRIEVLVAPEDVDAAKAAVIEFNR